MHFFPYPTLPLVWQNQFFLRLRLSIVIADKIAQKSGALISRTIWQLISRYTQVQALLFPPKQSNSVRNRLTTDESYLTEVVLALLLLFSQPKVNFIALQAFLIVPRRNKTRNYRNYRDNQWIQHVNPSCHFIVRKKARLSCLQIFSLFLVCIGATPLGSSRNG